MLPYDIYVVFATYSVVSSRHSCGAPPPGEHCWRAGAARGTQHFVGAAGRQRLPDVMYRHVQGSN